MVRDSERDGPPPSLTFVDTKMNATGSGEFKDRGLLLGAIVALVPAAAYFVIVLIGLLSGITGPARWLADDVLLTGRSVLPFLATVVGGPVLSVSLCLMVRGAARRMGEPCCAVGVLLLISNTLFGVLSLPFSFFLD